MLFEYKNSDFCLKISHYRKVFSRNVEFCLRYCLVMFDVNTNFAAQRTRKRASIVDRKSALDTLRTYYRGGKHVTNRVIFKSFSNTFLSVVMHAKDKVLLLRQAWVVDRADTTPMMSINIK